MANYMQIEVNQSRTAELEAKRWEVIATYDDKATMSKASDHK